MKPRMLCTDCGLTAQADTLLEGSDALEMLAWCCLALPGLLYCWWRHAMRLKVCPACGGRELVREARAARQRGPAWAPTATGPRVRNAGGPVLWPDGLATPRDRLRHGGVAALLAGLLVAAVAAASLGPAEGAAAAALSSAGAALLGWVGYQGTRLAQLRGSVTGCRAWDQRGRPLRIERVS